MINFSIIIPHKDIPDVLERCLRSIPQRNDLQVIVVDDDSDDPPRHCGIRRNDGRIEFLSAKDPKRYGAGFARNVGLEQAVGKWLIFADADDFFLPDFEKMLDKYADSDADMICFGNTYVKSEDISIVLENKWYAMSERIKTATAQNNLDIIRYDTGVAWCRFIKRELVEKNKIRFQETICRNDAMFSLKIGCVAKEIILDKTEIYCYTQRQNSLSYGFYTKKGQKDRYFVSKSGMKYLRKQNKGINTFDVDLVYHYHLLQQQNKLLYIRELLPILLLTTTKKAVVKEFCLFLFRQLNYIFIKKIIVTVCERES